jgi:hypothetical protein
MAHMSPFYTGDATANTWVQDFSPLVMAPPVPGGDIALWPIIGKLMDGTEPSKLEWIEEPLTAITISGTEGAGDGWASTTDTEWDFTSGQCKAAGIRIGTLLRDSTDKTKDEIVKVTAVSTDKLTVVRDQGGFVSGSGGGTTGQAHSETCVFEVVGNLNYEGSTVSTSVYKATRNRTPCYNYYSILDDQLQVTASDLVRVYRGSSPDNWGYQLNGLRQRLDRIFERTLILSPQKARSASEEGSMGGLLWYATQTSGVSTYSYVTDSVTFSYEAFDDGMLYLYNQGTLDGPNDIVCVVPAKGAQYAAYIHESALRGEYANETVRGLNCTTLMSTITATRVPIVPSSVMPSDSFMLLNLNAVRVHFAEGRALSVYSQEVGQNLNDYRAARPISELSFEFHRPLDNCYYHTAVTYTRPT